MFFHSYVPLNGTKPVVLEIWYINSPNLLIKTGFFLRSHSIQILFYTSGLFFYNVIAIQYTQLFERCSLCIFIDFYCNVTKINRLLNKGYYLYGCICTVTSGVWAKL